MTADFIFSFFHLFIFSTNFVCLFLLSQFLRELMPTPPPSPQAVWSSVIRSSVVVAGFFFFPVIIDQLSPLIFLKVQFFRYLPTCAACKRVLSFKNNGSPAPKKKLRGTDTNRLRFSPGTHRKTKARTTTMLADKTTFSPLLETTTCENKRRTSNKIRNSRARFARRLILSGVFLAGPSSGWRFVLQFFW